MLPLKPPNPAKDEIIRMRLEGAPFLEIAATLGVTKGVVAGVVHRAQRDGVVFPPSTAQVKAEPPTVEAAVPLPEPAPEIAPGPVPHDAPDLPFNRRGVKPPKEVAPEAVSLDGVPFADIGMFQCRWIVGRDPGPKGLVRFCGEPTVHATCSWCAKHQKRAMAPSYQSSGPARQAKIRGEKGMFKL